MVVLDIDQAGRARQIRRVYSAEAVALAVAGWVIGILLGWLIYEGLLALVLRGLSLSLPQDCPPDGRRAAGRSCGPSLGGFCYPVIVSDLSDTGPAPMPGNADPTPLNITSVTVYRPGRR
jgi:hypothetical protein